MADRTYYVISDDNCKFESMTKEEILAAITQAVEGHSISDVDTGFVTTIKEKNKNKPLAFWVGTTAEHNALTEIPENTFCIITDENDIQDILDELQNLATKVNALDETVVQQGNTIESLDEWADEMETRVVQISGTANHAMTGVNNLSNEVATIEDNITEIQDDISDLQTSVGQAQSNITALQNADTSINANIVTLRADVTDNQSDITEIKTKNGQVLLEQTVAYGGSLNIDLQGTYALTDFREVIVTAGDVDILCAVKKISSGGITATAHIVGTGTRFTTINNPVLISIDLTVNTVMNKLENNGSLSLTFALSTNTFSRDEVSITKIVGVA